jgi:uncharacterized protein YjbI with pentapeptide repeats
MLSIKNGASNELTETPTQKPTAPLTRLLSSHWLPSLLLALVLLAGFTWLGIQQHQIAQLLHQQHDTAVQSAEAQQQQAWLLNYYNAMSTLLTNNNLIQAQATDEVALVADAHTLEVLRQLDPDHKVGVMRFLYQTRLINNDVHVIRTTELDLHNAHLAGIDLRDTYLLGINMHGADLRNTNLSDTKLNFANLDSANLAGANLQASDLHNVSLAGANLAGANLKDTVGLTTDQLSRVKTLKGATMPDGSVHP